MKKMGKKLLVASILTLGAVGLSACSPEVGSKEWCEELVEKPKGDWTANEAAEYTKSCIFK